MIVRFTDEALDDLSSILAFLNERGPNVADRYGRRLVEAADALADFPQRGKPGLVEGTREVTTVWPYVIVYRVTSVVEILRVWHGAQDREAEA
jgi:plasmid stabilization system protein ParE